MAYLEKGLETWVPASRFGQITRILGEPEKFVSK